MTSPEVQAGSPGVQAGSPEPPMGSPWVQAILAQANALTRQASGNQGQVFGQIGLDALPCPGLCQHCSFSAANNSLTKRDLLSQEQILVYARALDSAGVHLLSLMATAAYDFDAYLDVVAAVRQAVRPQLPLLANLGDLDAAQARALKAAGADAIYHAVRVGEGTITALDPARRWQTIAHARAAGLTLMTGVEPLYEQQDARAVIQRMYDTLDSGAVCTGCCPLVPVPGTALQAVGCTPPSPQHRQLISAIYRLIVGLRIPFGLGGIAWVDAGTNPRGRHLSQDPAQLVAQVQAKKQELTAQGWQLPHQPLSIWQAGRPASQPTGQSPASQPGGQP